MNTILITILLAFALVTWRRVSMGSFGGAGGAWTATDTVLSPNDVGLPLEGQGVIHHPYRSSNIVLAAGENDEVLDGEIDDVLWANVSVNASGSTIQSIKTPTVAAGGMRMLYLHCSADTGNVLTIEDGAAGVPAGSDPIETPGNDDDVVIDYECILVLSWTVDNEWSLREVWPVNFQNYPGTMGTAGQVLALDSDADQMEFVTSRDAGLVLISKQQVSSVTSFTFQEDDIDGNEYTDFESMFIEFSATVGNNGQFRIRFYNEDVLLNGASDYASDDDYDDDAIEHAAKGQFHAAQLHHWHDASGVQNNMVPMLAGWITGDNSVPNALTQDSFAGRIKDAGWSYSGGDRVNGFEITHNGSGGLFALDIAIYGKKKA